MELSIQKTKQNPAFSINGEIIHYFEMHPKAMRQDIADFLSKKYGFKSTAGTILLKRDELRLQHPFLMPSGFDSQHIHSWTKH